MLPICCTILIVRLSWKCRSYEKKRGSESFWAAYIKELGNQQARGPQGAKSPLLWPEHQVCSAACGRVMATVGVHLRGVHRAVVHGGWGGGG